MSRFEDDHRLIEARQKDIGAIADKLIVTPLSRGKVEWVGPCPKCGGTDRFAVNLHKQAFLCRRCDAKGGVIDLVMFILGLSFPAALEWLCGPRQDIDPAAHAKLKAEADKLKAERDADAERYRQRSIRAARVVWNQGVPAEGTPVRDYLAARGIAPSMWPKLPASLRYHPDCVYMMDRPGSNPVEIYRGPAMLAAVQGQDDRFAAVHRTWIDMERPKGKAIIQRPDDGGMLPAKKVLGSKKGGAIRLTGARMHDVLVMGEGIETTATAMVAGIYPDAAYWAGVDLGNMAGQRMMGKGQRYAGIPDLDDAEAFVPPPWVKRLIFIQDGDSDPKSTRAKLVAGLRRAMALRPGLVGQIVHAGEGVDLNDVLMG